MSYLDKLQIQGIRSFDSNQSQVLQFYPLTIILGPNGAGKTSIIEALKYVTTGLTPPNSGSGKTFILDPVIANSPTVRAQVKLKFVDIEKKSSVITRSVELSAKKVKGKTSLSFKSLNCVINRDGKPLDQRCADINNEMLELLGVSKAVLNNVIFCHQDDSNWPMSESKVLKDKFDDIFGSMAYVKALDKIKKIRQTELQKQKLLEKDVKHSEYIKRQSDSKKKELKKFQNQLEDLKKYFSESETKISDIRAELSVIISKEESIQSISNQINLIKGSLNEKQKSLDKLKTNIKTPFSGTEDELKSEIENFGTNAEKLEEKSSLQMKEKDLNQNYSKVNKMIQNLNKELSELEVNEVNHRRDLKNRNLLVSNLSNDTNISIDANIIDKINSQQMLESIDIYVVVNQLKEQLNKFTTDLSERRNSGQQSSEQLAKHLNDYKSTQSKYEHEVQLWQTDQKNKKETLETLKTKMKSFSQSNTKYESLNQQIIQLNEEIKQLQSLDIESKKRDNQQKESEKKSLKNEINSLEEKLKELRKQNEERLKFEFSMKEKTEKQSEMNQIIEIHSDVMQTVGAIEGQFHSSLQNHIQTLNGQMDKKLSEISKKENELTAEMTKIDIKNESLKSKKRNLKELETKLKKVCKTEDFENTMNSADNELKELRLRLSEKGNYKPFLKTQIQSIESTNCCPVCERDVNQEWNSKNGNKLNKQELVHKLEALMTQTPGSIEELKTKIKSKEQEFNELIGFRSVVESIKSLNAEIPKIEVQINTSNEENERQKTFIQTEKMKINKQKTELNSLRDVLKDANDYDKSWTEIQNLNKKINLFDLSSDCNSESIKDLDNDLEQKKHKLDEIESQLSENQTIIAQNSEQLNKKRNDLQKCNENKLEIEKLEHEMTGHQKKCEELNEKINGLDKRITDSRLKAMELNPKITEIEDQIRDANKELEEFKGKTESKMNLIKDKLKEIERFDSQIDEYLKSRKSDEMKELNTKLSEEKNNISKIETEKQVLNEEINKLSEEISSFEVRKRQLKDNLLSFELENEINVKKTQLKAEEERLGFSNLQELRSKKRELERQLKNEESIHSKSEGKQTPIIEIITETERELNAEPYRSADNNYKQKAIDLAISEISGEDLNKYYKALDFAVSDFHRKKIEEINKLIKGFWSQAYKGLDIDYIKIVSDEAERSANDKRRTYNYRVVMVKTNTEMDMRGRCSAGQKVLASLIIRLALAEIFCINCSVLALDEPTTNLDKENITSFATAVTQIVKYRKKSFKDSNFQLIIITHDNEFLRCLDSETGQHYYKVFKNNSGFSTILRKSVSDSYEQNSENNTN